MTERGKDALKLLQTFEGVPLPYDHKKKIVINPLCPQDPQVEARQEVLLPWMTGTGSKLFLWRKLVLPLRKSDTMHAMLGHS